MIDEHYMKMRVLAFQLNEARLSRKTEVPRDRSPELVLLLDFTLSKLRIIHLID